MIKIYTDGSCLNNPGNGGWAAIINDNEIIKKITLKDQNVASENIYNNMGLQNIGFNP